jgi:hypothetical protein
VSCLLISSEPSPTWKNLFISLFLTQYIIEDLIDHPKVQDVFGDDLDIYRAVDSILNKLRPS